MKQIIKDFVNSPIVMQALRYPQDRKEIEVFLKTEQQGFCAYTEEQISVTVEVHVEHFNPELKNTSQDNYGNWFLVSAEWNLRKGTRNVVERWIAHQPILYLTDSSLESRIAYYDGCYYVHEEDIEAKHLVNFLKINDYELVITRQKYISALKEIGKSREELQAYLQRNPVQIRFRRAIEAEFGFSL